MESAVNLGEKIRQLRVESKITQKQIAQYLGIDQSMISKIEGNERHLSVEQMDKLSVLFGCNIELLETIDNCHSPLQFAFRANEISHEDFEVIAAINRIALNLREMKQLLGGDAN